MEELLKKVGNAATLAVSGFNFITSGPNASRPGITWSCVVVDTKKGDVNAIVGERTQYSISDMVTLCAMDVTVTYEGDSDPDLNGVIYPRLRISKYTPKGR